MREKIYSILECRERGGYKLSAIYDVIMIVMIVISIVPLGFAKQYEIFRWFDVISVTVFIIDYLLRWSTADFHLRFKRRWLAFLVYPFTLMAIVDMLSILPSLGVFEKVFKMFRIARLMKILRVFKFLRYSKHVQILLRVFKKEKQVLFMVLWISIFYILLTALIMFNVEMGVAEDGTVVFATFFDAIYWAATTLTTVGYGDIYPVSDFGRVISMISSLFGVAIIALPSGVITASYLEELREWKKRD